RTAGIAMPMRPYDHAYLGLEADRPSAYTNAMRVHFHADGGVLLMPRPTRVGLGVLVEAGSAPRWLGLSDAELQRLLVARAPILEGMRLHREGAQVYALARGHADRYVAGPLVILGDAAHVTNPTAGQGMAMALADAGLFADAVGPALAGARDLDSALAEWQARQWSINQQLVRTSHLLALVYALRGPAWDRLKTGVVRTLGQAAGTWLARAVIRNFLRPRTASSSAPGLTAASPDGGRVPGARSRGSPGVGSYSGAETRASPRSRDAGADARGTSRRAFAHRSPSSRRR